MKTRRLFYEDEYLKEFTATVLSCRACEERYEVVLDQTAFYPEGGGQPADIGEILVQPEASGEQECPASAGASEGIAVLDVQYGGSEAEPEILHFLEKPLPAGAKVIGKIDWMRRFDLMQQHSGEHIVSGLIHEKYGYDNVGFHMGEEFITIDLSGMLTEEQAAEIERLANDYIWQDRAVRVFYPKEKERESLPYRSKKELTGEVRLVEFPGADLCACCGLHVTRAGEIGLVKIISCKKFRKGVRMEMLSGRRAYQWLSENAAQNTAVAVRLSVKDGETQEAVERLFAEIYELKGTLSRLKQKAFTTRAQAYAGKGNILLFEEAMNASEIQKCADALLDTCGGIAAVLSGDDGSGYKYAVGMREGNVREFVKEMNTALNGKGGGKPFFAQGYVRTTREAAERFFKAKGFFL